MNLKRADIILEKIKSINCDMGSLIFEKKSEPIDIDFDLRKKYDVNQQSIWNTTIELNESKTSNVLPKNINHRLIKRIINKLIMFFTRNQVKFNFLVSDMFELISVKFNIIVSLLNKNNNEYNEKLNDIYEKLDIIGKDYSVDLSSNNKIEKILEEQAKLQFEMVYLKNESKTNNEAIGEINYKIHRNDERIDRILDLHNSLDMIVGDIKNDLNFSKNRIETIDYTISYKINEFYKMYHAIRDELFFEINKLFKFSDANQQNMEPKFKDSYKKKVEQNNGKIFLNVGSGPIEIPNYISVDMRDLSTIDIVADVHNIGFNDNEVDEILVKHVIEHFTENDFKQTILPYWYKILKKDAHLRIIVPNATEITKAYVEGSMNYTDFFKLIFGGQDYAGNYHYSMYTVESLTTILKIVGFANVEVVAEKRKNDICLEMEIIATK